MTAIARAVVDRLAFYQEMGVDTLRAGAAHGDMLRTPTDAVGHFSKPQGRAEETPPADGGPADGSPAHSSPADGNMLRTPTDAVAHFSKPQGRAEETPPADGSPADSNMLRTPTDAVAHFSKPQGRAEGIPPADGGAFRIAAPTSLSTMREEMGDCQRCKLCSGRTNIVFGSGAPDAALMFVGEGPGEDEDRQGLPFVGKAGQLLTRMIVAMGLSRERVYIANIVKCRPPNNRNPQPDEIAACQPFLYRQIQAIRPKIICALGTFSAQTLLQTKQPISALRGRFHDGAIVAPGLPGMQVMPTFHPAYLLRSPGEKKKVWEDLQQIMQALGPSPPPEKP